LPYFNKAAKLNNITAGSLIIGEKIFWYGYGQNTTPTLRVRADNTSGTKNFIEFLGRSVDGGDNAFLVTSTGLTGLGVAPTQRLDVDGLVRIRNLTGTATAIMGYDANGVLRGVVLGTGFAISGGTLNFTETYQGTVTSVNVAMPAGLFSVSGGPITSSGTITAALIVQAVNTVFAGPSSGGSANPTFRALVAADIPNLDAAKITTGVFGVARGGTGLSALGTAGQLIRVNAGASALEYFTFTETFTGTVTSVALSLPGIFSVTGSPVTTSGTLAATLVTQLANAVFAGPTSGGAATPAFRALVAADIPNLDTSKLTTGILAIARGGTGLGALGGALQQIRVNAGGSALEYFTPTAGLSGSGAAGQVGFWTGTSALGGSNNFFWDNSNIRLGIHTASPQYSLHINRGSVVGTWEGARIEATTSGAVGMTLQNTWNAGNSGDTFFDIAAGGTAGNDPYLRFLVPGSTQWSIGMDNSDADKLKIKNTSSPSQTTDTGITIVTGTASNVGINKDAPAHPLDVTGRIRGNLVMGVAAAFTHTFGAGAGTSPTLVQLVGSSNGFFLSFTTGSSPTANGTIITITYPTSFGTDSFPVFCAASATAATDVAKFYVSGALSNNLTFTANGTLSASTTYSFHFVNFGY
jgi:hypothetical protein